MYALHHELPNDLKLRILENWKISRKSLKCGQPKTKIWTIALESWKISAVEIPDEVLFHSIL